MENLQGGILALEHRYQIDTHVGFVGLRTFYKGTQHPFDKAVWICIYDLLEGAKADKIEGRIKASAQEVSALDHEGVLRVLDYGEVAAGVPFVVSERVGTPSLSDRLTSDGAMSPSDCVALVMRLADILERAHDRKVYHGTLGPECVWMPAGKPERARIGMFGLGLTMSEIRQLDEIVPNFETVSPLAPEIFAGKRPSVATDVYSLGALAYECLSGQHPYFEDREDISAGLIKVQKESNPRPLSEFGVDSRIAQVVERAVSWNPSKRWVSVSEFASELESALEPAKRREPEEVDATEDEESFEAQRVDEMAHEREPGVVLGVLVLLLVVSNVGWFFFTQSSAEEVNTNEPAELKMEVLKPGVEFETQPPSTVYLVDGESKSELGGTPLSISPSLGRDGQVEVEFNVNGSKSTSLKIEEAPDGYRVVLPLEGL